MSKHTVINIDPFDTVAGHITVKGVPHDVLHLNGRDYRTLNLGTGGTALELYAIAARVVPSLGEGVYDLSTPQLGAVIAIADARVADVENQFPNSEGPTTTASAPAPA